MIKLSRAILCAHLLGFSCLLALSVSPSVDFSARTSVIRSHGRLAVCVTGAERGLDLLIPNHYYHVMYPNDAHAVDVFQFLDGTGKNSPEHELYFRHKWQAQADHLYVENRTGLPTEHVNVVTSRWVDLSVGSTSMSLTRQSLNNVISRSLSETTSSSSSLLWLSKMMITAA